MEDGPWTIRNVPVILNEWSPNVTMEKQDIKTVPVWIKMHDIPLTAFTEDGLSLLASKIGNPKMLDSYTATMCAESWGRSSFARALVEIHADKELKKSITVAIPSLDGNSHAKVEVKIDYDWEPMRCSSCCVFGHNDNSCAKNAIQTKNDVTSKHNDDFQEPALKTKRINNQGVNVKNQKPKFTNRPVVKAKSKSGSTDSNQNRVQTSNSFDILNNDGGLADEETSGRADSGGMLKSKGKSHKTDEVVSDDTDVDNLLADIPKYIDNKVDNNSEGASTPGSTGAHG
ncbi:uncharacterized protein LOC110887614 [Helianthus annuus]|uniref:uncharacterized protein LOC110887614 n=1 Tax=Helianthus annuus TaxID=4232 RepID=UPI000B8FC175|nr:uncharacterized protein LOC110887614 [Helianthus annuus]